jgi:methionine-rich copper-binding protein CopC
MKFGLRLLLAATVVAALVVTWTVAASAHALYVSSVPNANSIVTSVPTRLVAKFAEGIVPATASLTITGPNGARADNGDGHVDLTDPARQTMIVTLKTGLGSGVYTVHWATVSSDDGDPANGSFTFTIALPAPAAPVAKPAVVAASLPASLPKTGGTPLPLAVGLGLVLALGGLALNRAAGRANDSVKRD